MHADSHYVIGHEHAVCQDYAATWVRKDGTVCGAIADGCSSAPDSDIGARALVLSARFKLFKGLGQLSDAILEDVPAYPGERGVDWRAWRATLGLVVAPPQGDVSVALWGDGVVIARKLDGTLQIIHVNYTKGAPPYLAYRKDPNEVLAYQKLSCNGAHTVTEWTGQSKVEHGGENLELNPHLFSFKRDEHSMVMVCSDGLASFTGMNAPSVDKVARMIADIPSPNGQCVLRKVNNGIRNICRKNGWSHADDIAVAAVMRSPVEAP